MRGTNARLDGEDDVSRRAYSRGEAVPSNADGRFRVVRRARNELIAQKSAQYLINLPLPLRYNPD